MSDVVEIYTVRGEESIRDGALDISYSIETKTEAKSDAISRCNSDRTIRKVAYYIVRDDGSFKTLFAYDNPDALTIKSRGPRRQMAERLPTGKGKPPAPRPKKKPRLMGRLVGALKD